MSTSSDEAARLAALRGLKFLYTPRHRAFADVTTLAARLLDAPIAFVSLVEQDHQFLSSCVGLSVDRTPRDISFCTHAIARTDLTTAFVVPDAAQDPLFRDNPLVTGSPHIRLYVGQPLLVNGHAIGTLCVVDTRPRTPDAEDLESLAVLARSVVAVIVARRDADALRVSEQRNRTILEAATDAVVTTDACGRLLHWNAAADVLFGLSGLAPDDRALHRLVAPGRVTPGTRHPVFTLMSESAGSAGRLRTEAEFRRPDGTDFTAELSLVSLTTDDGLQHTAFVRDMTHRLRQESQRRDAQTRDVVIFAMARLAEARDPETGAHLERVQRYCRALAEELLARGMFADVLDEEFVELIYTTSPLHDIGKVGIPDHVLLKPGRLTPAEFEVMKTHAALGADTLAAAEQRFPNTRFLRLARNIAATHHEKFDGTGYPRGMAGDAIPLCGRIVALADVYDALTSRRVYKPEMPHEQARTIIANDSGRHFDPRIVAAFLAIERQFVEIHRQYAEPTALAA